MSKIISAIILLAGAYYLLPMLPQSFTVNHFQHEPPIRNRFDYEHHFNRCMKLDADAFGCNKHAREMAK